jgi:hypothetical protein
VSILALSCLVAAPSAAVAADGFRQLHSRPSRVEVPPRPIYGALKNVFSAASATDPVGDTFDSGPDLTGLTAEITSGALVLGLTFDGQLDRDALEGFIDIDADENGNTGVVPWTDSLQDQETTGMGNELYVDLFSFDIVDSAVDVVEEATQAVVARARVDFTSHSLTVTIPLVLMGDDGRVNVAAVVLADDVPSDVVPNQGSVKSTVRPSPPPPCATLNTTDLSACMVDGTNLCLNDGRFEVTADWATTQGTSGVGQGVQLTDDSGYFWFFAADNIELTIKVLDACTVNGRFWVFASGLTNVEVELQIRDTETGQVQVCRNPLASPFRPILDTNAFSVCP